MTYRLVFSAHWGPWFLEYDNAETLIASLVSFHRRCSKDPTATLWKRVRGAWVPAFPWQHGDRE